MPPEWEPKGPRAAPPDADADTGPDRSRPGSSPTPAWALALVRLLDDALFVPGTHIGVGLDAILGFFLPTIGDVLTGLASLSLLVLGFQMRVPKVVLARMAVNILLDTLLGAVPILGDAFDLFWRSNRRNLELIQRYETSPARKATSADYLVVGLCLLLGLSALALPVVLGFALLRWLWHAVYG